MRRGFAAAGFVAVLCTAQGWSVAEPCAPAAVIEGDDEVAGSVSKHLERLGVATRAPAPCPAARAAVRRTDTGLAIVMRDRGRRAARTVSTAAIAATWIESWVRTDIGAPLLRAPIIATPTPVVIRRPATRAKPMTRSGIFGASVETLTASDQSEWRGVSVSGCVELGRACVGVAGRYGHSLGMTSQENPLETDRKGIDLLATVSVPLVLGRGVLAPRLGIGAGWLTTSRPPVALDPAGNPCDPQDPNTPMDPMNPMDPGQCDPVPNPEPGLEASTAGLRLDARIVYAIPVSDSASVELGLGGQLRPGAHRDAFRFDTLNPDGTNNPMTDPTQPPDPFTSLPGEPEWLWSAGIGLRVQLR